MDIFHKQANDILKLKYGSSNISNYDVWKKQTNNQVTLIWSPRSCSVPRPLQYHGARRYPSGSRLGGAGEAESSAPAVPSAGGGPEEQGTSPPPPSQPPRRLSQPLPAQGGLCGWVEIQGKFDCPPIRSHGFFFLKSWAFHTKKKNKKFQNLFIKRNYW